MRSVLALFVIAFLLPAGAAGAPYEDTHTIGVGSFAGTSEARYMVTASAGETITAVLSWDNPEARLFLSASVPGSTCPFTNPVCIANAIQSHEICSTTSSGQGVYSSPQVLVLRAPAAGTFRVSAVTFLSTVTTTYTLSIAVGDGGSDRVTGPTDFFPSSVNGNAVQCLAVRALPK